MKAKLISILVVILFSSLGSATALAVDHSRNWESGQVVQVTNVHIKDGMFNAYINDLNNVWRKFMEARMKDGDVISYDMYSNPSNRKGEADLILVVTFANWAAFDRGADYFEKIGKEVLGSPDDMRTANINRGELREIGSTVTWQEIKFKN